MKTFILTLFIVIPTIVFSAPVITGNAITGNWTLITSWNLLRTPASGDTVIIPSGKTVVVTSNISINTLYVKVYGTLKMNGGILDLGNTSIIMVYPGGKISGNGCSCEQIRIGNSKKYQGDPDVIGPQFASSTSNDFDPFIPSTALPVKFTAFTLTRSNHDVLVQWSTSEELNAESFQLERSTDGTNYAAITTISASGNSNTQKNYSYTDRNNTARISYYRIKETDKDGSIVYTVIKTIKNENIAQAEVNIYASGNKLVLEFNQQAKGNVVVRFITMGGQVADQQTLNQPSGQVILNNKLKGHYVIMVSNNQDLQTARQIIL